MITRLNIMTGEIEYYSDRSDEELDVFFSVLQKIQKNAENGEVNQ